MMPTQNLLSLRTPGYHGFSVEWGVFDKDKLAVTTAVNFGMKGPGKLYVFSPLSGALPVRTFDYSDSLMDVAWSESSPTVLLAASADGSIILFDIANPENRPTHMLKRIHGREVNSVDWNGVQRDLAITASFDSTVGLFNMKTGQQLQRTKACDPTKCANEAAWNPQDGCTYAVATGDGSVKVFDLRQSGPVHSINGAHQAEVLCVDWNKYEPTLLASGSVDQQVKIWDLRSPSTSLSSSPSPVSNLSGHYRAVRRVKWSPFHRNQLSSCGYDMTVRFWATDSMMPVLRPAFTEHTEFVTGLSYSLKVPGLLASCAWDESIHFHNCVVPKLL